MKSVVNVKDIYGDISDKNRHIYLGDNGLHIRDIEIEANLPEPVEIGHVSDLHFNYCNQQDLDEAHPALMSTLENRKWLANAESVPTARRCLEFISDADLIVANGDTLDYLSHGAMEIMQREIWDRYPQAMASLASHDMTRKMQGKVIDPTPREEREKILQDFWPHNIVYASRILKNKVCCAVLLNDLRLLRESIYEPLKKDIEWARENGGVVLIFGHEGFCTRNPKESCLKKEDMLLAGDFAPTQEPYDFCHGGVGGYEADEATKKIYDLIVNSADVVRGVFAGHHHNHMYLEILGKTPDGQDRIIPQYVNTASAYDNGHVMRILVK
ncbi:MAG: hypothetical protein E7336_02880 [Clostridiales bacterium]|nr:hypothetical protein [Clostridiales bacterium]